MGTITIQFSNEADQAVFVDLLARAIQQATAEPLGLLVSALRGGAEPQAVAEAPKPAEPASELLDVNAVAALLGASSRTVRRLADCGKMPRPVSLGRIVRWQRSVVEEWISQGCPRTERRGGGRLK